MARTRLRPLTGLLRYRWLRWSLCAVGGPLLGLGCGTTPVAQIAGPPAMITSPVLDHSYRPAGSVPESSVLQQVAYQTPPEAGPVLPAPGVDPALKALPGQPIRIDLDEVLRLADIHNPQIALARAKVDESILEAQAVCARCQLPWKKIARQIEADVKIWQRKAELSKTCSEVLQDAATTYFDLLTARQAFSITQDMARKAEPMLKRSEDLQKNDPRFTVLYEATRAEVIGREQALAKLKQQGDAVAAKLGALLGLPCDATLTPVDPLLVPLSRIDAATPTCKLVEQALATGPAIEETRGMLAALQAGHAKASRWLCLLPKKKAQLQHDLADNREMQIELGIQELAGKLTAGVLEARGAILLGQEQQVLGQQQIEHTNESYRLSELRVRENVQNAGPNDVLQAIRGLEQAQLEYLTALSSFNKAQIRLLLLLGAPVVKPPPPPQHH